jgi:tRNA dimethylallyltransferase
MKVLFVKRKDMNTSLPKVIVLVGPTASGKTEWGLNLAKKFGGEIIAADSRQIYKRMDIGTAKPRGEWRWHATWKGIRRTYYVDDIPHHLVDIINPGKRFTAAEFRDSAVKYIKMAEMNGSVPFVVGGTGLYVSALVDNFSIPRVAPNGKLRESLEGKTEEELFALLKILDPVCATTIDARNKRRLIRALEVCIFTGKPFSEQKKKGESMFQFLQIGIDVDRELLYSRIDKRIDQMVEEGVVKEVEELVKRKFSWDLPSMSGIGYRQFRPYIEKTLSLAECIENLKRDTRHYARRQMTWFRREKGIRWCERYDQVETLVDQFLKK